MNTRQPVAVVAPLYVHVNVGVESAWSACDVASQTMAPLLGPVFTPLTLGVATVPSSQVKFR